MPLSSLQGTRQSTHPRQTKTIPRKLSMVLLLLRSPDVEDPCLLSAPGAHTDLEKGAHLHRAHCKTHSRVCPQKRSRGAKEYWRDSSRVLKQNKMTIKSQCPPV